MAPVKGRNDAQKAKIAQASTEGIEIYDYLYSSHLLLYRECVAGS